MATMATMATMSTMATKRSIKTVYSQAEKRSDWCLVYYRSFFFSNLIVNTQQTELFCKKTKKNKKEADNVPKWLSNEKTKQIREKTKQINEEMKKEITIGEIKEIIEKLKKENEELKKLLKEKEDLINELTGQLDSFKSFSTEETSQVS